MNHSTPFLYNFQAALNCWDNVTTRGWQNNDMSRRMKRHIKVLNGLCKKLGLIKDRRIVDICVKEKLDFFKSWNSPNPEIKFQILNHAGEIVGTGCYGVSPLHDKVYLYQLEIEPQWRRQGFGFALIQYISQRYRLPITPIHERHDAQSFWNAARRMFVGRVGVTIDIRASEMDEEQMRWQHLQPEIRELEREICLRVQTETWDSAIRRGLKNSTVAYNGGV